MELPGILLDAKMDYQSYATKIAITFHNQAACAACCPKVVCGHTGVTSRIGFGDVDNPEAPIIQDSYSGKTADTEVTYFFKLS